MKHLIAGLVALGLGLWGLIVWWKTFGMVMRGVIPFAILVFGLVAILSGLRRMGPASATRTTRLDDADEDADEDEDEQDHEEQQQVTDERASRARAATSRPRVVSRAK